MNERWIQYVGPPLVVIVDQGKEFMGTELKEFTNVNSIHLHIIDVRAPWQNGWTERHGDIYKRIFERARWMHSPSGPAALQRFGDGVQRRQESTAQSLSLLSLATSVRDWTSSSCGTDQRRHPRV